MNGRAVIAALLLCGLSALPAAAGDAQAGHLLARQWCTGCHIVDDSNQGRDTAPPFATIARRHAGDRGWVRAWLNSSHPSMPNFNLSRQQIDDVIAYLDSLAPR